MSILKPSFYKQSDSRWAKKSYQCTDGGYANLGCAGCGPTSVTNIINVLIKPIKPATVFKYACKQGYMTSNSGMYRSAVEKLLKHYGIEKVDIVPQTSEGKQILKGYLKKNYWCIALMGKGLWTNGGHYIVAYYVDSKNYVYISDSASSSEARQLNRFDTFYNQMKEHAWLVVDPASYIRKGATDKSKTIKTVTLYTNNGHANVRAGRTTNSRLVATLKRNTALKVYDLDGKWWRIGAGTYKGYYINSSNLSKYATYEKNYKTLYKMNVRAGYSTSSDIIGSIEKGRAIRSSKQKGNWAYIPSVKGWVCIKDSKRTYLKRV